MTTILILLIFSIQKDVLNLIRLPFSIWLDADGFVLVNYPDSRAAVVEKLSMLTVRMPKIRNQAEELHS